MKLHFRALPGLVAACLWAAGVAPALAEDESLYPQHPIQLVVPSGPGTGHDLLARILSPKLSAHWKVPVYVQNRVGATGNIGTDFVAKSPPDGYTLLCVGISFATSPAINTVPFDPVKSFAPIELLASSIMSVIVPANVAAKTFPEFVSLVRGAPGKFFYASPGNGTAQHLGMELIKRELGLDMTHVPFKTTAPAMVDLMEGHVQAMIAPLQTAAPHVRAGKIRMLATMSEQRSPAFPEVPTLKELGHPQLVLESWYGLFAPAGTPQAVIDALNREVNAILSEPDVRGLLAKQGQIPAGGSPSRLGDLVRSELARWVRVVQEAGIRKD